LLLNYKIDLIFILDQTTGGFILNFFDQFQVTDKALGKVRSKYIKQIEKDLGQFLEYQSAFIPTVNWCINISG
jgi:hypothetical protein